MKNDFVKDLRAKSAVDLKTELGALRKEQFNLRMQRAMGQGSQTHLAGQVRRKIAQVKTVLRAQQSEGGKTS